MIRLYQSVPLGPLPDASPFCVKLDLFFRLAGIDFTPVYGIENLQIAPRGKIPFIEIDGDRLCDSALIIEWANERFDPQLNDWLSREEKAIGHAVERMTAEALYWGLVHHRWIDEDNFATVREIYFQAIPMPQREELAGQIRADIRQALFRQGIGRYEAGEIRGIVRRDLVAISDCLGAKDFFFGSRPAQVDASLFAFVAGLMAPEFPGPLRDEALSHANLVRYCERITKRYYPRPGS